jgi:hypothetical protein
LSHTLWVCLVDRLNSESSISIEILLFGSPVYLSGHCPTYTNIASRPCPVAKPKSSFATELGRTRPENLRRVPRQAPKPQGSSPPTLIFPRRPFSLPPHLHLWPQLGPPPRPGKAGGRARRASAPCARATPPRPRDRWSSPCFSASPMEDRCPSSSDSCA